MYKNVKVISKNENLKVKEIKNYRYAKELTQSIITIDEFYKACKSFPIIFTKTEAGNSSAVVLLGIENKNLFVNSKGEWKKGEYIPFYVRRYPFNFYQKDDTYVLVYDEDAKSVNDKEGEPLFDENQNPTEYTSKILDLMETYQVSAKKTELFIKKLEELELLEDAQITIKKDGKNYVITSLQRVNEEKLNNLSDEQLLELVKSGMYNLIIAHLISLDNINKIASL